MKYSSNYKKHTSKNPVQQFLLRKYIAKIVLMTKPLHPASVIDLGCGEGLMIDHISSALPKTKFTGIDISKNALAMAKKLCPHHIFRNANIYTLPYKDNMFDAALCLEVLEHLDKPEMALQEILRVSKKYCILSVPNEPIFRIANFLRGKNISRLGNDREHIKHWSTSSFVQFVRKYSTIVEITNSFPWTIVLAKKE